MVHHTYAWKRAKQQFRSERKGKIIEFIMVYFHVLGSSYFADNVIWTNLIDALLSSLVRAIVNHKQKITHDNQKYIALILLLIIVYLFVDCLKHKVESKYSSYGIKRNPQKTFTGRFDIWTSNQCSGSGNEGSNI